MTTLTNGSTWQWRRIRLLVLIRDRYICHWCGERRADSVDHVIPRIEGGTDSLSNLVASCRSCNSRRAAQWVNSNGRNKPGDRPPYTGRSGWKRKRKKTAPTGVLA